MLKNPSSGGGKGDEPPQKPRSNAKDRKSKKLEKKEQRRAQIKADTDKVNAPSSEPVCSEEEDDVHMSEAKRRSKAELEDESGMVELEQQAGFGVDRGNPLVESQNREWNEICPSKDGREGSQQP